MVETPNDKVIQVYQLPRELQKLLFKEYTSFVWKNTKFKHFVMIFSLCALLYQTRKLLSTYLLFETVVKVEITKPYYSLIPAVSVCTDVDQVVLKSKLREKYPQLDAEIEQLEQQELTQDVNKSIHDLYIKYKREAHETLLIDEWFKLTVTPEMVVNCTMWVMPMYFETQNRTNVSCTDISEPYYNLPSGAGICWTFFSQVNRRHPKENEKEEDFYRIELPDDGKVASFQVFFDWYDDVIFDDEENKFRNEQKEAEVFMVAHHPRSMVSSISLDRAVVTIGKTYDLYFQQTSARLLKWPYRTNCVEYRKVTIWKQWMSSADCIEDCLSKLLDHTCNCTFNQSRGGRVTKWGEPDMNNYFCKEYDLRDDEPYPESDIRPRVCHTRANFESRNTHCNVDKCNLNCFEEFFRFDVKEIHIEEEEEMERLNLEGRVEDHPELFANKSYANVTLSRKDVADVCYEHTAEMTFVELVCYFGGLLGLWLGISILDMYDMALAYRIQGKIEYRKWLQIHYHTQVQSFDKPQFSDNKRGIVTISSIYNTEKNYSQYMDNVYS